MNHTKDTRDTTRTVGPFRVGPTHPIPGVVIAVTVPLTSLTVAEALQLRDAIGWACDVVEGNAGGQS